MRDQRLPLRHAALLVLLCLALYLPGLAALPPLDRDEARFAQASRQMVESGDWVDIRFQDEPRYKKPIGAYWLQAASARLLSPGDPAAIWAYRLPSVAGATAAVLLTGATAALFLPPAAALAAAALLASSVLLVGEAHQAKTDALLLAAVAAAQFGLARAYLGIAGAGTWVPFWLGVGTGMLVKGPVAPLIPALTIAALAIADRRWRWLLALRPLAGLPIALAMVAPWILAIQARSGGAFLEQSVGGDLLPKLFGGMEAHGGPPGLYLALVTLTFWPASLLLWPALPGAWRQRATPAVRFLLAWAGPAWLLFELVPTKLPHYVLPLYPALAMLCAWALHEAGGAWAGTRWRKGLAVLVAGLAVALGAAAVALPVRFGEGPGLWSAVAALAGLAAAAAILHAAWTATPARLAATLAIAAVVALGPLLHGVAPSLGGLFLAPRLAESVRAAGGGPVSLTGFSEPSAIFLLGTATPLVEAADAAARLAKDPGALVLVEARERAAFDAAAARLGVAVDTRATIAGFNYSKGRPVSIALLARR